MTNPATPDKATPTSATDKSSKVLNSRSNEVKQIQYERTFDFYKTNGYLLAVPSLLKWSPISEKLKVFESILRIWIEKESRHEESMKFQATDIDKMERFVGEVLSDRDKTNLADKVRIHGRYAGISEAFFPEIRRAEAKAMELLMKEYDIEGKKRNFGIREEYQAWKLQLVDQSEYNKRTRLNKE